MPKLGREKWKKRKYTDKNNKRNEWKIIGKAKIGKNENERKSQEINKETIDTMKRKEWERNEKKKWKKRGKYRNANIARKKCEKFSVRNAKIMSLSN